jgi:hypothetical protein
VAARDKIKSALTELVKDGNALLKKFADTDKEPPVHLDYQAWYSKALPVVEWLAKDRYDEFRRYYEPDPKRKSLGYGTYVIQDYLKGVKPGAYALQDFDCREQAAYGVYNQLALLTSVGARADSVLGDIQGALYAELQDEEVASAAGLLKVNVRAAGALAGVVLEAHLQKVAAAHGVKITKKSPTVSDINEPLKAAGVYDLAVWRKLSYLADIRNLCAHKKAQDPSPQQVAELVEGVGWAIKNIA